MKKGDFVTFVYEKEVLQGTIEVIDAYGGGFYNGRCTSVDILGTAEEKKVLFKHIPVLDIISLESGTDEI